MKKVLILILVVQASFTVAQVEPRTEWWLHEPFRLIQTNLREIDAIDFDMDVYVQSLHDVGANAVLINVGGIVGNYYTDLEFHWQNTNLKFNLIKEVVDRLHQENIRVIGRFDFSKLNEAYAAKNPDWLYKGVKGEEVNYNGQVHTCVNGGYQQEYSLKILDEALTKFPLDGVFFNMIGYRTRDYSHVYHGICQSEACHTRFAEWSGGKDLPKEETMEDPVFRQYQQFKSETSSELFVRIHDLIKSHGDHIAINTYTHAGTDFYRKESNSHSSLYDGKVPWEYSAAHNIKSTLGSWKDKQTSNAAVHFYGYPARHSADARWLTQQRLVQNMIYGGGLDFYCIGRLDNLEDRPVLENVRDVFQFHKAHENYFHHTLSGNKVLMLHDRLSGGEYHGIFEILTENHVLFDVMEHWCLGSEEMPRELSSYELVVLPDIARLSEEQCALLDQFVAEGGKILATGLPSTQDEIGNPMDKIRLKALGVEAAYEPFDKVQGTYFRIFDRDKEVLGAKTFQGFDLVYAWEKGMLCEPLESAEAYLGFIPPAMIGPPEKCYYTEVTEIPGLIHNSYGKGQTALLTFRLGSIYHHTRHYGHAALIMTMLNTLLEFRPDLHLDDSPMVEVTRQIDPKKDFEWYGLLNHTGQLGNAFFKPVPLYETSLRVKPQMAVKSVKSLKGGQTLNFELKEDGWIQVLLPELNSYDVLLVEY
jgi:hypothetical protein